MHSMRFLYVHGELSDLQGTLKVLVSQLKLDVGFHYRSNKGMLGFGRKVCKPEPQ